MNTPLVKETRKEPIALLVFAILALLGAVGLIGLLDKFGGDEGLSLLFGTGAFFLFAACVIAAILLPNK